MKVELTVRYTETRRIITDIDDLKEGQDLLSFDVWTNAEQKIKDLPATAGERIDRTEPEVIQIARLERRAND